jgi:hypothetical protein
MRESDHSASDTVSATLAAIPVALDALVVEGRLLGAGAANRDLPAP